MGEVLLHCKPTDSATLPIVAISELCFGPVASKEFVLDMERQIAYPPAVLLSVVGGRVTIV